MESVDYNSFSFSTWKIFWHFLLQGLGEESVFIQTDGSYCCTFPSGCFQSFSLLLVSPNWVIMGLGVDWLICLGFTSLRSLGLFFHQIWENFRPVSSDTLSSFFSPSGILMIWMLFVCLFFVFSYRLLRLCSASFLASFLSAAQFGWILFIFLKFTDSFLCHSHYTIDPIHWVFKVSVITFFSSKSSI